MYIMNFTIFFLLILGTVSGFQSRTMRIYNSPTLQPRTRPILPPSSRIPQTICSNNSTKK